MTRTTTDRPTRETSGAVVPVLAFAGIVVAVMQTLLVPVIKDLPQLLDESREGIERVTKIVQDLKEFSHVGDETPRAVDLHKGLDSTLNIVWNDLKYKVQLDKHYGELPLVECHSRRQPH